MVLLKLKSVFSIFLRKVKTTFYWNLFSNIFCLYHVKNFTMDKDNIVYVGKHEMKKIMLTVSLYLSWQIFFHHFLFWYFEREWIQSNIRPFKPPSLYFGERGSCYKICVRGGKLAQNFLSRGEGIDRKVYIVGYID